MPYLSPPTLTRAEVQALLRATAQHLRDHLIFSLALATGLRVAEVLGALVRNEVRLQPPAPAGVRALGCSFPISHFGSGMAAWSFFPSPARAQGADRAVAR